MVKVLVKKLDPKVKLPSYKTRGSSGMDLIAFINKPINIKNDNKIKQNLAPLMDISETQISVKATTTDGLGFIGKSEGWSAFAIATLIKK